MVHFCLQRVSLTRKRAIECHDARCFGSTVMYDESGTDRSARLTVRDRRAKICISWAPSCVLCGVFVISTSRPRIVMRASDSTSRERVDEDRDLSWAVR